MKLLSSKKMLLALSAIGLIAFSRSAFAKNYDYEKITVDIGINQDGTFDVTENMTYNLDGDFGFFNRDIALKGVDYISDIEVYGGGQKLNEDEYNISTQSGEKHVQWNFPRRDFINEQKSWTLKYKVHGGLGFYKDHDEIYWNAIFKNRDVPVKLAQASVHLPWPQNINKMTAAIYSEQETAGFKKEIVNPTEYYFEAHDLKPNVNFTIAAGWEKGKFNYTEIFLGYWLAWYRLLGIFLPILTFALMFMLWHENGRDPKVDKTIIAEYEPPNDLGPLELEVLLNTNATMKGISATLIDLAVRGYLKIAEKEKKWWGGYQDYEFEILKDWETDAGLRDYERILLEKMRKCKRERIFQRIGNLLARSSDGQEEKENVVSSKELRMNMFGKECRDIFNMVYENVAKKGEFTEDPRKSKVIFVFIGAILATAPFFLMNVLERINTGWLVAGVIISGIIMVIFGNLMPQKTSQGAEDKYKWLCFKLYLETAEKYRLRASTPEYFEKYLPYAIIFGVEKKWAKKFEEMGNMKNPAWYVPAHAAYINSSGSFSPTGFAKSMSSMVSSFAASSGGGAGGGGAAGGGGGGGGGGAG